MDSVIETIRACREKGTPVVGCFPLYPPLELLHAMGLRPVVLWELKGIVKSTPLSDRHLQPFACSVARHLVEIVLSDYGAILDGLLMYNACDTLRNLPEIIERGLGAQGRELPIIKLHIPAIPAERTEASEYLARRMDALVAECEAAFGVHFSSERFLESQRRYGEMRALLRRLEALVGEGRLSYRAFSRINRFGYLVGVEEQVKRLRTAVDDCAAVSTNASATIPIVVSGILPPPPAMIDRIERCGLRVVANDVATQRRSYGYQPPEDGDPGGYYADFYRRHHPCTTLLPTADRRVDTILSLVEESGARGLVFIGEKFCEYESLEFPHIEGLLRERGVSSLRLEMAIDDYENCAAFATRIEAFAELLKGGR